MKNTLLILLCSIPIILCSQIQKTNQIGISILNNATLLPPESIYAVFNQPLHPGINISYELYHIKKNRNQWFHDANMAYIHHRYVSQSILIFTKFGYRHLINNFIFEGSIHTGYMHSFSLIDRALLDQNGNYKNIKGIGKAQFICGTGIGIGYQLGKERRNKLILNYDFRLQMPFVKNYVPLLPNGTLSIGILIQPKIKYNK